LEIGTRKNHTFNHINIEKTSVDPDPESGADYEMTSDEFFQKTYDDNEFDIIFIDALHESPQLYKDIMNSLRHLSKGGTIICHDTNPVDFDSQVVPRIQKHWNGDVWKDIVNLRTQGFNLEIYTIDTDEGCTIIRMSSKMHPILDITNCDLNYKNLEKNRKQWLNLISVDEFINKLEDE